MTRTHKTYKILENEKETILQLKRQGEKDRNILKVMTNNYGLTLSPSTLSYYEKEALNHLEIGKTINLFQEIGRLFRNDWFWKLFDLCFFEPIKMNIASKKLGLNFTELNYKIMSINKANKTTSKLKIIRKISLNNTEPFQEIKKTRIGSTSRYIYMDFSRIFQKALDAKGVKLSNRKRLFQIVNNPLFRLNLFLHYSKSYPVRKITFTPNAYPPEMYSVSKIKELIKDKKADLLFTYLKTDFFAESLFELFNKLNFMHFSDYSTKKILYFEGYPITINHLIHLNEDKIKKYLITLSNFQFNKIGLQEQNRIKENFVDTTLNYFNNCDILPMDKSPSPEYLIPNKTP